MFLVLLGLLLGTLLTIISPVSGTPVTLSKSTNAHFPDTSKSTLQYTFRVTRDEEDTPEIHYSIDEITYDPYARFLDFWVDDINILNTTFSNDKTGVITTDRLRTLGTHTVKIQIYSGAYSDGCYALNYLKLDNIDFDYNVEKIAFLIYQDYDPRWEYYRTSGIITSNEIDDYCDILEADGYSTYVYQSPSSWISIIGFLDYLEDEDSIVLLYIPGHGYYTGADSRVQINFGLNIYSDDLRTEIDKLESKRICVFIDACQSGGFKDDLEKDGVTVITSNDYTHSSRAVCWPWIYSAYPMFSRRFFNNIFTTEPFGNELNYMDDYNTFRYVRDYYSWSYGFGSFKAMHSFFGP